MTPINCLVVDDNKIDRFTVEDCILECGDLKLIGSFENPLESIELLKQKEIHLLFLDIDMPVINGINFFKTLSNPPICIFITSHPEYALDAFDVHAFDYMLKPVKQERFEQTIKRVKELFNIREKALNYDMQFEGDSLTIKEGNSINKILINDIIYLEALTNYTKIVTKDKKYITLTNLKNLLEQLPEEKFIRVHRSYAVARNKINTLKSGELLLGDYIIPIGKTYRSNINKAIMEKAN